MRGETQCCEKILDSVRLRCPSLGHRSSVLAQLCMPVLFAVFHVTLSATARVAGSLPFFFTAVLRLMSSGSLASALVATREVYNPVWRVSASTVAKSECLPRPVAKVLSIGTASLKSGKLSCVSHSDLGAVNPFNSETFSFDLTASGLAHISV